MQDGRRAEWVAVRVQGACLEEDKMLLITEFMDGGDLHKAINKRQIAWDKRRVPSVVLCRCSAG